MTTDLWMLVLFTLWGLVLIYIPATGRLLKAGVGWGLGNRDGARPEFPAWVGRAERAQSNHAENWPLFAAAVLIVHQAGKGDDVSAVACQVFLGARMAHGLLYLAGAIGARTLAYYLGVGSMLTVYSRLLF
jgi:uncharacterized MAPEG superfamily protein